MMRPSPSGLSKNTIRAPNCSTRYKGRRFTLCCRQTDLSVLIFGIGFLWMEEQIASMPIPGQTNRAYIEKCRIQWARCGSRRRGTVTARSFLSKNETSIGIIEMFRWLYRQLGSVVTPAFCNSFLHSRAIFLVVPIRCLGTIVRPYFRQMLKYLKFKRQRRKATIPRRE